LADPGGAQSFTLKIEKCNFIKWINKPHIAVEFETINDDGRRNEANMLRPQIAVTLQKCTRFNP
jgi:hypothetical protein